MIGEVISNLPVLVPVKFFGGPDLTPQTVKVRSPCQISVQDGKAKEVIVSSKLWWLA